MPATGVREVVLEFAARRNLAHVQSINRFNSHLHSVAACLRPSEIVGALGGIDGGRLPERNSEIGRNLPAAVWNFGKARTSSAARNRFAGRALCKPACRRTGICGGVSGILFWPDLRGAARTRDRRLQPTLDARPLAGDDGRDGEERL